MRARLRGRRGSHDGERRGILLLAERSQFLFHGGFSLVGCLLGSLLSFEGSAGGGRLIEFFQGAVIGALGGIQTAVQTVEAFGFRGLGALEGALIPDHRHDLAETAKFPVGGDEGVDEADFGRGSRQELAAVVFGKGLEFGGIFTGDDLGFGVNAGFQSIEASDGKTGGGWAGTFQSSQAVRRDLRG